MNIDFGKELSEILDSKGWSQADLARRTGRSRTAISDVISGKRQVGKDLALDIADALNIPPAEMFRMAGLLPPKPNTDEIQERIDHLYSTLKDPANKQRALDFMEFLKTQDEKGNYDAAKPQPQPK